MINSSPQSLQKALYNLLNRAEDYVADVCFDYPAGKIWAHRAILQTRCPKDFRQRHMPELDSSAASPGKALVIDKPVLPRLIMASVLRFWYTAQFGHMDLSTDSTGKEAGPDVTGTSPPHTSAAASQHTTASHKGDDDDNNNYDDGGDGDGDGDSNGSTLVQEIHKLEVQLGTTLLPRSQHQSDLDQLVADLDQMRALGIGCDVIVNLMPASPQSADHATSFPCHRFILASRSDYFKQLLCDGFIESSKSTVTLTEDIFTPVTLQVILRYFYTDKLHMPEWPVETEDRPPTEVQKALRDKMNAVRVLQGVFQVADFLGPDDTLRDAALYEMSVVCHAFTCCCSDCAILLPSMVLLADDNTDTMGDLRETLLTHYTHVLNPMLWSSRTFAALLKARPSLALDMETRILANANKHTAIHVIPFAHTCISHIHGVDPVQTWSCSTLNVINRIVRHCVSVVADNFEFYCGIYPILLSCVDGIKGDFSVGSLEFLLKRLFEESIHEGNAGMLYRGIVRHLLGRHETDRNTKVYNMLLSAKQDCVQYLQQHWPAVKAQGGFKTLDKETLTELAEDLNVPVRSLTKKSFDSSFPALFRFRIKHATKTKKPQPNDKARPGSIMSHSLSFRSLRVLSRETTLSSDDLSIGRISADDALQLTRAQPSLGEVKDEASGDTGNSADTISLLDELLPPDLWRTYYPAPVLPPSPPLSASPSQSPKLSTSTSTNTTGRHQRIKFELPVAPQRVVPAPSKHPVKRRVKRSRSPLSFHGLKLTRGGHSEQEQDKIPEIGAKVELMYRPLPTHGIVKFVGPVQFAQGTWVGIELEARLGNNDGSVDGVRYFQTHTQRGAFCKPEDLRIIRESSKSHST